MSVFRRRSLPFVVLLLLAFLLSTGGCVSQQATPATPPPTSSSQQAQPSQPAPSEPASNAEQWPSDLKVHFIDVGQADAILVQVPGGKAVLIDAGNRDDGGRVVGYLQEQGVKQIDVLIATHPHEDHIGGLPTVIGTFPIKRVIDSGKEHTSGVWKAYIQAVAQKNIPFEAAGSQKIDLSSGATLQVLGPTRLNYEDLNNVSVVAKLSYGDVSFLFTGDMEGSAEADILGKAIKATVLKVGHHGSDSSTTPAFLAKVAPKYAVISVGKDNDYGHPSRAVIDRLKAAGVSIYRTDEQGTVVLSTDGKTVAGNSPAWVAATAKATSEGSSSGTTTIVPVVTPPPAPSKPKATVGPFYGSVNWW